MRNRAFYLANMSLEMIGETSKKYFEKQGWQVDGNWLNSQPPLKSHHVVVVAPAIFNNPLINLPKSYEPPFIYTYLLFPDQIVGWDYATRTYLRRPNPLFTTMLSSGPLLSHSDVTLRLVIDTYYSSVNAERCIMYLPTEFYKIRQVTQDVKKGFRPLRVLWHHTWRSDKGFPEALALIDRLSRKYPTVEFHIGRDSTWGNLDRAAVQAKTEFLLLRLRARENIYFHKDIRKLQDYWRFLGNFDIGFSVSFHEGFGLGMLEQAAAGLACVVPDREAYPEIHQGAFITTNVEEGLATLLENHSARVDIAQSCIENAKRFNAEEWSKRFLQKIISHTKEI